MTTNPSCPLKQAEAQEIAAKKFGFYWKNIHQILEQIQSECSEVQEAYQKGDQIHLQEEIGDLMQAAVCLAVYCQFDPHETLQKSIDKFQKRYDQVVALAKQDGHIHLQEKSTEELMKYWKQSKAIEKESNLNDKKTH